MVKSFHHIGDEYGDGVGDIEAFGEAVHRDFHGAVAAGDGFVGEPCEFGAEPEGGFVFHRQVVEEEAVFGGQRGHELVAGRVELVGAPFHIARLIGVVVQREPFVRTHGNRLVNREFILLLHDMDILDAVAFAGAHHRADVLRLEKVFQYDGEMAGAVRQHRLYARVAFRRDEGAQIGNEFGFLSACEAVEKFLFEFVRVFSPHDAL